MGGHAHSCSVTHQDRSLLQQPPLHHHGGPFPELGLGSASPRPRGHAGGGAPGKMAGLWQRGGSWLGGSSQHAQQTLCPFPEPQARAGGRGCCPWADLDRGRLAGCDGVEGAGGPGSQDRAPPAVTEKERRALQGAPQGRGSGGDQAGLGPSETSWDTWGQRSEGHNCSKAAVNPDISSGGCGDFRTLRRWFPSGPWKRDCPFCLSPGSPRFPTWTLLGGQRA